MPDAMTYRSASSATSARPDSFVLLLRRRIWAGSAGANRSHDGGIKARFRVCRQDRERAFHPRNHGYVPGMDYEMRGIDRRGRPQVPARQPKGGECRIESAVKWRG